MEGSARARVKRIPQNEPFFTVEIEVIEEGEAKGAEIEALMRSVHQTFENYVKLNKKVPAEVLQSVGSIDRLRRASRTRSPRI